MRTLLLLVLGFQQGRAQLSLGQNGNVDSKTDSSSSTKLSLSRGRRRLSGSQGGSASNCKQGGTKHCRNGISDCCDELFIFVKCTWENTASSSRPLLSINSGIDSREDVCITYADGSSSSEPVCFDPFNTCLPPGLALFQFNQVNPVNVSTFFEYDAVVDPEGKDGAIDSITVEEFYERRFSEEDESLIVEFVCETQEVYVPPYTADRIREGRINIGSCAEGKYDFDDFFEGELLNATKETEQFRSICNEGSTSNP